MKLKRISRVFSWAQKNIFISLIVVSVFIVGIVLIFKLFSSESEYVYAKVKVSQGLWWANTSRPSMWYVQALKKGSVEMGLSGEPIAEVLSVRYYTWYGRDQFDVYMTIKIAASKKETTNTYSFKRSNVAIAAPIELDFGTVQVTGTVMDISESPFSDEYIEKTITLTKRFAYPWEFSAIQVGDTYFDGEDTVFEITSKRRVDSAASYVSTTVDRELYSPLQSDQTSTIEVIGKIKLMQNDNVPTFGPEYTILLGNQLNVSTTKFNFYDYFISSLE